MMCTVIRSFLLLLPLTVSGERHQGDELDNNVGNFVSVKLHHSTDSFTKPSVTCSTGGSVTTIGGSTYCSYAGKITVWSMTNYIDQDADMLPPGTPLDDCIARCDNTTDCACSLVGNDGGCYRVRTSGCGNGDPSTLSTNTFYTTYEKQVVATPATPAACTTTPTGFTQPSGTGYCADDSGAVMKNYQKYTNESLDACKAYCTALCGCVGLSYSASHSNGNGLCQLHGSTLTSGPDSSWTVHAATSTASTITQATSGWSWYQCWTANAPATPAPAPSDSTAAFSPPWNDSPSTLTSWTTWCAHEMNEGCYACQNSQGAGQYCQGTCAAANCPGF